MDIPHGAPSIATPEEVLATFTQLLRSEKPAEQLKAAEQLAKYHSLFTPKDEGAIRPEVIAEVEAAVRKLQAALLEEETDDAQRHQVNGGP